MAIRLGRRGGLRGRGRWRGQCLGGRRGGEEFEEGEVEWRGVPGTGKSSEEDDVLSVWGVEVVRAVHFIRRRGDHLLI